MEITNRELTVEILCDCGEEIYEELQDFVQFEGRCPKCDRVYVIYIDEPFIE